MIHTSKNHNESFFTDTDSNPIVTIPSLGKVIGSFSTSSKGRNYSAFRGIPYAKPPIEELRFKVKKNTVLIKSTIELYKYFKKDPKPVEPWENEILDATNYGFSCIQPDTKVSMSEDCLTLNIFTHGVRIIYSFYL